MCNKVWGSSFRYSEASSSVEERLLAAQTRKYMCDPMNDNLTTYESQLKKRKEFIDITFHSV
jgi:hypothetical protein